MMRMKRFSRSSRPTGPKMRVPIVLQDHRGVLVELDVGAVAAPPLLHRPHDDSLDDLALLAVAAGDRVLDRGHDDVADAGVPTSGTAEHPDAQDLLGSGVVGDLQPRLLLDHFAFSTISISRQRLVALSGRVSITRTRSPTPAVLASSCTFSRVVCRSTLPYRRCLT